MKDRGWTWGHLEQQAADQNQWRSLVEALCVPMLMGHKAGHGATWNDKQPTETSDDLWLRPYVHLRTKRTNSK